MTTTANLLIPELEVGQGGAEAIINQGLIALDLAVAGYLSKSVAGNTDVTLTDSYNGEAKNATLKLTGLLTGSISLVLPALARHYVIFNATTGAFTITAKTAGGAGAVLTQGTKAIVYCDGTDTFVVIDSSGGGGLPDAKADGATKGVAAFTAADFTDNGTGLLSLDYANAQKATASVPGFLTAADWSTFTSKVSTSITLTTSPPLSGGGDLSTNRTIAIADAAADGATKGAAAFTAADFNAAAGVISLDYTNAQKATASVPGFLTAADWSTFNSKGDASTNTSSSVDSEVALFSGTGGKTLKRATGTGLALLTSGVQSAVAAPSGAVVGTTDAQTLTNKVVQPRVVAVSDATSFTPNADTTDILTQANTQATGTLTVGAPSGTPYNGQKMEWLLKSTNVQTFALNAIYRGSTDLALPTTTMGSSKKDRILWQYDSVDTKWDFLAIVKGF